VWNDADLSIQWPDIGMAPQLSAKDEAGSIFASAEVFS
jgi:dTDP-4-dehydrorhamnose 3,5-epimerase